MPTSSEVERVVTLPAGVDLHARPAAQLVRMAAGFAAAITVATDGREANAKSLLDVLEAAAGGRRDGGRHGTLDDRGVDELDVPVGA